MTGNLGYLTNPTDFSHISAFRYITFYTETLRSTTWLQVAVSLRFQQIECMDQERADEERKQKKLDKCEAKVCDLQKQLKEKMRQVEESQLCYRALRHELEQFNVLLKMSADR